MGYSSIFDITFEVHEKSSMVCEMGAVSVKTLVYERLRV